MIIEADEKGKDAINRLADVALKSGGIQNLDAINQILSSVRTIKKHEDEPIAGEAETEK